MSGELEQKSFLVKLSEKFPKDEGFRLFLNKHPYQLIIYTVAVLVVYVLVVVAAWFMVGPGKPSGFANLLYTGPGTALGNRMGSCLSNRESGPYDSCGAAEPFASQKRTSHSEYGHLEKRSGFADQMNIRNFTEKSRFLGSWEADPVGPLDQHAVDTLQTEVRNMSDAPEDEGAAYINSAHTADGSSHNNNAIVATSRFASKGFSGEDHLASIAAGRA